AVLARQRKGCSRRTARRRRNAVSSPTTFPRIGPRGRLEQATGRPGPTGVGRTMRQSRMYRIGVDIGGTFTDFALVDASGSKLSVHKRLTTPHDPSEAVIEGIGALLQRESVAIAEVGDVVHGTTLVTNAVIERRGALTGMLVTAGFGDIIDM